MNNINSDMWDTHIHCLDPVRYPFKPTRSYTPAPAPLELLVKDTIARNIVLVQASVEHGHSDLVSHLGRIRSECPNLLARGIISLNEEIYTLSKEKLDTLHGLWVRFCRIHGYFSGSSTDTTSLQNQIKLFARSYAARTLGWGISAQLPFTTWLALRSFLCEESEVLPIPIIIDHVGCSSPVDIEGPGLDDFIMLLRRDGASCHVPSALLWGSDWPHVDSSYKGDSPPPVSAAVDAKKELLAIIGWLSAEQISAMLVDNAKLTLLLSSTQPTITSANSSTPLASDDRDAKSVSKNDISVENSQDERPTDAMAHFLSYEPEYRRQVEKQLLRKVDTRILPLIVLIYLFNYLDRNSITQARLYGLEKDTGLEGAEYQTAISIFSAGYILMQLPATILMTKLRPSIFLPCCIILWAIVSGCTSAVHSTPGLLMVRFFLGFVEAPFFPGAVYFLSCWYTKREIGVRMALLICGILLSNAFAGLISAGILSAMEGVGNLASWRWLFIIEGLATLILGLIGLFILPDFLGTTKWLSDVE
ncbi:unnamed protein product [Penicillium pancosmium]